MEYPLPEKDTFCLSRNFFKESINFPLVSEVTRGKKTFKVSFFQNHKQGKLVKMCKINHDFFSAIENFGTAPSIKIGSRFFVGVAITVLA